MAKLLGIATRPKRRAEMATLDSAAVSIESGIESDYRGQPGNRQVTVMSKSDWDTACQNISDSLSWTTRRANLLVDDIAFPDTVDRVLRIGEAGDENSVQLLITRETAPCERMDEYRSGLREALGPDWRGGVCCRVLRGGKIKVGDDVTLL